MTTEYNVVYPPKGRAMLDGGLNNKFERSIIAENESPDCLNVVFTNGAAATRPGSTKLNTLPIGTFVGDGLYTRRDRTTAETMVAFVGGSAYALGVTTFVTIPSAVSVFTAGVRVGAVQYENHMFIGNGGVNPYKYNGAHFTRHGVPAPTATAGVSTSITGLVSAQTWVYGYTYVNSQAVEGDISPFSTPLNLSVSSAVSLTSLGIAPTSHGINSRRIYRATTTVGPFKLVGTISDNTTTTFTDNVPTASLGALAPTDNGEPPKWSVACYHQNRLFVNDTANPNFIWYSEIFEPYTFPSTNFILVGDASSDLVRGLDTYNNSILISCENSQHLLNMPSTSDTDWGVIRILSNYGTKSPYGAFLYNNRIMLPAIQNSKFAGFTAVRGESLDPEATQLMYAAAGSDLQSDRIEPEMFLIQETYVGNISAMVFKNKAYVTATYGANNTTNNRVYVFDFSRSNLAKQQTEAWSPIDGLNACQFTIYGGKLYYLSSTATGFVYQLESSLYSDDGGAINSYLWTKEFSGNPGHENLQKDFRKVKLLVDKPGAYYMNLTYRVDSDKGVGTTVQVDLNPGSTIWNAFNWGAALWGGGTDQQEITIPLGSVTGKRIQFKVSNQNVAGQRFKVHGLNFTYNIKGVR